MAVSIELVKELREETGISIMQCRKALEEADGDKEKAMIILRKLSGDLAAKKSDRTLGSGAVGSYLHATGTIGSMVVLSSETDFVSKNEDFRKLAHDLAMQVAATAPEYLSMSDIPEEVKVKAREVFEKEVADKPKDMQDKILEGKLNAYFKDKVLLEQDFIKNPEVKVSTLISEAVQKFGERVEIAKFVRVQS